MDLHKIIEKLPKDLKFNVVETKSIFKYEGSRLKVARIKEQNNILEITVIRI
jgi:TolB-like protein